MSTRWLSAFLEAGGDAPVVTLPLHAKTAKIAKTISYESVSPIFGYSGNFGTSPKKRNITTKADHCPIEWDAADWQEFYNERAGVAEHDGRQPVRKPSAWPMNRASRAGSILIRPYIPMTLSAPTASSLTVRLVHHAYQRYQVMAAMYGCTILALIRGGCGDGRKLLRYWQTWVLSDKVRMSKPHPPPAGFNCTGNSMVRPVWGFTHPWPK